MLEDEEKNYSLYNHTMDILLNALEIGAFWLADGIKWAGQSSTVWQEQPKVHGVTTAALSKLLYAGLQ